MSFLIYPDICIFINRIKYLWTEQHFLIRHFHIGVICVCMKFTLRQHLCAPRRKWDDKNNMFLCQIWLLFVHFNISWVTCWVASQRFHLQTIWTLSTLEVNPAYLVLITVQSAIKNACDVFSVTTFFRNCSLHTWLVAMSVCAMVEFFKPYLYIVHTQSKLAKSVRNPAEVKACNTK